MTIEKRMSIAIIGGGASGVMMAAQLLQASPAHWHIHIIEPDSLGAGVAYRTQAAEHRLNVIAAKMSAYPDKPDHFLHWVRQSLPTCTPETFAPRSLYREYLQYVLQEAQAAAPMTGFSVIAARVLRLDPLATGGAQLYLDNGATLQADKVILALGNQPARRFNTPELPLETGYIASPWVENILGKIQPADDVLVIGAGLTAVDVLLSLHQQGHHGAVTVISRHGHWPLPHPEHEVCFDKPLPQALPETALSSLRWVRQWVNAAIEQGVSWQSAIDALRPSLNPWWAGLSHLERCRFVRHMMPIWNIVRHRIPIDSATLLENMTAAGQLRLLSGRLQSLTPNAKGLAAQFATQGGSESLQARWVVNCTGPNADLRKAEMPLLKQLFADGLIQTDALQMGLALDAHGAVMSREGEVSTVMYALGPLRRGTLIESIAVPEIRVQAAALAQTLTADVECYSKTDKSIILSEFA